jgi:hypothetical protein
MDRVFVIQQIGAKDSLERKRADEIFNYIVAPAVKAVGLDPYRADLDLTPGAITPKMLTELLNARVVIADLTGRNPNVFYELGITHSFARPLISIADSISELPFDAKDERVIELGEYPSSGLAYVQGEQAKAYLQESLRIVLAADYSPPSPLREVAANASVDQLAPENPVAAEMAQMREALEEIRKSVTPRTIRSVPNSVKADLEALRSVVERNMSYLDDTDFDMLITAETSRQQDDWAGKLQIRWARESGRSSSQAGSRRGSPQDDPWATESTDSNSLSDEPPF